MVHVLHGAPATAPDTPGVTWIHGSSIGMAESSDGGATWTYRGTADIRYGRDTHPNETTYWRPRSSGTRASTTCF